MNVIEKIRENKNKPQCLIFSANWCRPCQNMKPQIEILENNLNNVVKFIKITNEECPDAFDIFNIDNIPSFILTNNDYVLGKYSGSNIKELLDFIGYYLNIEFK